VTPSWLSLDAEAFVERVAEALVERVVRLVSVGGFRCVYCRSEVMPRKRFDIRPMTGRRGAAHAQIRAVSISTSLDNQCGPLHHDRSYELIVLNRKKVRKHPAKATRKLKDSRLTTVHRWRGSMLRRNTATTGRRAMKNSEIVFMIAAISIMRPSFMHLSCDIGGQTQYARIGLKIRDSREHVDD